MKGKKLTFILSILLAAALVPLAAAADLPQGPAHHSHTAVTLQSQSQFQSPSQSQTQEQAKTFTGKVTKSNGRYVLEDETMNSTYYLDDTKSAQKYEARTTRSPALWTPPTTPSTSRKSKPYNGFVRQRKGEGPSPAGSPPQPCSPPSSHVTTPVAKYSFS